MNCAAFMLLCSHFPDYHPDQPHTGSRYIVRGFERAGLDHNLQQTDLPSRQSEPNIELKIMIIQDNQVLMDSLTHLLPVLGGFLFGSLILYYIFLPKSPFPIINAPGLFDFTASKAKAKFVINAKGLIRAGYAKVLLFLTAR